MGSSDFLYDLLEYLEKDNTDYLLITVDKGDKSDKVDLYYQAEKHRRCIYINFTTKANHAFNHLGQNTRLVVTLILKE